MAETLVKTCGITSPADAVACVELGADYLGLIFAYGPRRVTLRQADAIREVVPEALLVGVLVDERLESVVEIARACRLDMLQLHGSEDPDYCAELSRRTGLPIIKAIGPLGGNGGELAGYRALHGVLFDLAKGRGQSPQQPAGLWEAASAAVQQGYRVFLAGGLSPENVAEAIRRTQPFCVDVARGVECAPGVKDHERVRRFIEEVRQA